MSLPLRPKRGGFLRPFGVGWFIREFLRGNQPGGSPIVDPARGAPIDDVRAAYKAAILRAYAEDLVALALEKGIELSLEEALRRIPQRRTSMRSHSFYRYFHHLKRLGWVERTGEEEPSYFGGSPGAVVARTPRGTTLVELPQPRRYYRLTPEGWAAPDHQWSDPLASLYGYTPEQRRGKKPKPRKPGSLPRQSSKPRSK